MSCLRASQQFLTKNSWFQVRSTTFSASISASGIDSPSHPTVVNTYIHTPPHTYISLHILTHKHTRVIVQMMSLTYSDVKPLGFRTFWTVHRTHAINPPQLNLLQSKLIPALGCKPLFLVCKFKHIHKKCPAFVPTLKTEKIFRFETVSGLFL